MTQRHWLASYGSIPHDIDANAYRSVVDMLEQAMRRFADKPAMRCAGQTLTYADIDRLSRDFAAYLQGPLGVKKGDRIAVMVPNLLAFPIAFLGIIRAVQDVVGLMVLGGVFERHPRLKLVVAESDAGWLPHYMYRMDHAARMNFEGSMVKGLSKLPSDYIRSNVWATFQDDVTAYHTMHLFPHEHLLWASDFPHTDSTWPHSRRLIDEQASHLTEAQHQAIFRDNTARLFNLPAGDASWRMEAATAVA